MATFVTSDSGYITLSREDLDKYPDSLLTCLSRWSESSVILVENINRDQLNILESIYTGRAIPDPSYYSNSHLYQFQDGMMINMLDYFMIPIQEVDFQPIPQDETGDSETDRTFTDDFNANWELSSIPETSSEVSDWTDDEGIWE